MIENNCRPRIFLVLDGPGLGMEENLLLEGLRSLYGYDEVRVFTSCVSASLNLHQRPRFLICVFAERVKTQIEQLFDDRLIFELGVNKILAVTDSEPMERYEDIQAADAMIVFGESIQGPQFKVSLRKILGPEDEPWTDPELLMDPEFFGTITKIH